MRIRLSFPFVIAFLLLSIVCMELHEIAHISVGRLICGCWGERDFNFWTLCKDCTENHSFTWLATLAGPVFSFSLMWIGMFWLSSVNSNKRAIGFSLIFANIPFGRIAEVMKGAGDEMVVARSLLKNNFGKTEIVLICSVIVLALGLPPIIKAFKILTNKKTWLYVAGFLTLPILFILIYILTVLNSILNNGFLSVIWIMGTPLLITIHTIIAVIFLATLRKHVFSIFH